METGGDVTATPAIADGVVYFPTWGGEVYSVSEDDGSVLWRANLTQELNNQKLTIISRNTPVVHEEYLLIGIFKPALQLALDRRTGNLLWSTLLDSHPYAGITCSGSVFERYRSLTPLSLFPSHALANSLVRHKLHDSFSYVISSLHSVITERNYTLLQLLLCWCHIN